VKRLRICSGVKPAGISAQPGDCSCADRRSRSGPEETLWAGGHVTPRGETAFQLFQAVGCAAANRDRLAHEPSSWATLVVAIGLRVAMAFAIFRSFLHACLVAARGGACSATPALGLTFVFARDSRPRDKTSGNYRYIDGRRFEAGTSTLVNRPSTSHSLPEAASRLFPIPVVSMATGRSICFSNRSPHMRSSAPSA
jgi:hypothetical protein